MQLLRRLLPGLFMLMCSPYLSADSAYLIPTDNSIYRLTDELYLNRGALAPTQEQPMTRSELRQALATVESGTEPDLPTRLQTELDYFDRTAMPLISLSLDAHYESNPAGMVYIDSNDYDRLLDFRALYQAHQQPSILDLGFQLSKNGFSIRFKPELRASVVALLDEGNYTNLPLEAVDIDMNIPYEGIAAYYHDPVEFRFGRGELRLGSSEWSSLILNPYVPYYDYFKARYFHEKFSLSAYLINLNPIITAEESAYLDSFDETLRNPEPNAPANGESYVDRFKNYFLGNVIFTPWPWLSLTATQTNLIAGRPVRLSDVNPLSILHNTYAEGVYSVPLRLSAAATPLRGVKIYGEYMLYDAVLGDELDATENPTADAFQIGGTLLSNPWFDCGPGRLRFDGEYTSVSPWTYGKYYNLRKFTSRFNYVVGFHGRFWTDYPLGYYLGPDTTALKLRLGYGNPGLWEVEAEWSETRQGEIDMYGYGEGNDYSHIGESDAYPLSRAPTGTPEITQTLSVKLSVKIERNWMLTGYANWERVTAKDHAEGVEEENFLTGIQGTWTPF